MNLTWEPSSDELLVNSYRPLPQLIASKLAAKEVQQAFTQGHTARFRVEDEQFRMVLTTIQSKSRFLPRVPDLEIQVRQSTTGVLIATLTGDCRKQLQAISEGVTSVSANIGVTKIRKLPFLHDHAEVVLAPTTSRKELAQKYSVPEQVIQNWCSMCSLRSSLTAFNSDELERLELYKRLSDAGVRASDILLIFNHWQ